ncbi:fumarylacetoacetate hydrolase family protein (plasmid) [Agrobacterium tumefaciens]|jgi:2-keto-4-pentenoate hydratase/2-oxohepta-3-ene-1,7-dioic acid hydratase in catechol pathway|uniref:fumarylacetoacetate hydrolase family protein n=1 Tax=Agrobacterium TaxID=357 RepID=UPI00080F9474|nr:MULTISPECIES: fumarylacetoacetate hydrolase family protein [Agrobacterium]NSY46402.1 fumarylacetoacetate hydrolase family protein [Agrobacterium tumefaciens]NSZ76863.1 fumarylacetoacetate hydrolase family protein [Agrobacterium tumefaciens]NSZ87343.1 fumarylacetoacetate hydrolase family protein [Agrobacterium tumefaciens]UZX45351.1 fumarylacetoacetate hydrolase family protein [Agrobacterium sp. 13-2099-1-2]WCA72760.1 fumarylacetoacetate hydrolase family protein [Agrobacterium tumefaciens]
MKLLRYGPPGAERPAMLDDDGTIRDLSAHVADLGGDVLSPAWLAAIAMIDPRSLPAVASDVRIGACIARPGKFICLGLNYHCNAAALKQDLPPEPVIAMKPLSAICGAHDGIELPRGSESTDWEVELGVVIGTRAKYIDQAKAMDHVAGYCLINDLADRELQSKRGGDTSKGRGHDSFGPIGPYFVPAASIPDPHNLRLWLDVDGERLQDGTTADMAYGVAFLVAYLSQFMTLLPGDIISTGTPAGIGVGMNPPRFLKAGQTVRLGAEGLGEQYHRVRTSLDAAA